MTLHQHLLAQEHLQDFLRAVRLHRQFRQHRREARHRQSRGLEFLLDQFLGALLLPAPGHRSPGTLHQIAGKLSCGRFHQIVQARFEKSRRADCRTRPRRSCRGIPGSSGFSRWNASTAARKRRGAFRHGLRAKPASTAASAMIRSFPASASACRSSLNFGFDPAGARDHFLGAQAARLRVGQHGLQNLFAGSAARALAAQTTTAASPRRCRGGLDIDHDAATDRHDWRELPQDETVSRAAAAIFSFSRNCANADLPGASSSPSSKITSAIVSAVP